MWYDYCNLAVFTYSTATYLEPLASTLQAGGVRNFFSEKRNFAPDITPKLLGYAVPYSMGDGTKPNYIF